MLKALRFTVKFLVSFLAIMTLAMLLFIWRVSNGPVELDGYSPFFRNLLIEQGIGQNVAIDKTILTWRSAKNNPTGNSSFEIRFLNVEIENPTTSLKLEIPEAGMQFSTAAFFRGVLAPTFVEFSGLELNLLLPKETWNSQAFDQEEFVATMRAYLADFNGSTNLVPRLTKQLLAPPNAYNSTGYLQHLTLVDTAINLKDELSGDVWKIPDAQLDIMRFDGGISMLVEGAIDFEENSDIPLQLSIIYNIAAEKATTEIGFSNFIPSNVAGEVEGLSSLSTLNIPVGGKINFAIDKNFDLPVFNFEFDVGNGLINPGKIYKSPIKIDQAMLSGQFILASDEISLDEFFLQFDGARVEAQGTIRSMRNDPDVLVSANVENMPLINLKTYWPPELLANARNWIEDNITGGMITDGVIDVNIRPEMWALETLPPNSFIFNFNLTNGSSHYLKPMPELTNIMGSATLRLNRFQLNIQSAKIEKVDIENGVLHFNDIAHKGEAVAHFVLPIKGRVEEILKVIDNEPLGYPSDYGIKPDTVLGNADTVLTLDFPLIKDLMMKDVEFDVQADIDALYIPKLSDNFSLSEGVMKLSVNRQGITSTGDIILNGVDFKANWTEDFTNTAEFPTSYTIEGDVEGKDWDNLYLPFVDYIEGPSHATLTLNGEGAGLRSGSGHFDFKDAKITFEPLGWLKNKEENASTDFTLLFDDNETINVNNIAFKSEGLVSDLDLIYDGERTSRLYIKNLKMPDNDFSGLFEWDSENELYQVSLNGHQFNAIPIMDIVLSPVQEGEKTELPDFNLAGSVENVKMYNDVEMQDATVLTGYVNDAVIDFGYSGKWDEDKKLSIIIASSLDDLNAPQKLTLQTNDAGQALRSLDFFTSGDRGDLLVEADMERMEKGYSLSGIINAKDFTVANSKAFSELLKEKEFSKAQEELEANGLSFTSFDSEFKQYDDVLTFISGTAKGPTLGVTLDGFVDQKFDQISLGGTIIPAYGINSLLSNIPLIGTILAGGKGEGVFAATYNMTGTIEDPEVKINPLMALAPGILRKIFGAIGGGTNSPSARTEAEQVESNKEQQNLPPEEEKQAEEVSSEPMK